MRPGARVHCPHVGSSRADWGREPRGSFALSRQPARAAPSRFSSNRAFAGSFSNRLLAPLWLWRAATKRGGRSGQASDAALLWRPMSSGRSTAQAGSTSGNDAGTGAPRLCTNCGEQPRAIARKDGRRVLLPVCVNCLRYMQGEGEVPPDVGSGGAHTPPTNTSTQDSGAPRAGLGLVPDNGDGHADASAQADNYCNAVRNGNVCKHRAGWGTDHPGIGRCKQHGGSTPDHRKHAAKVQAQMHAVTMGAPVDIDPHDALLWCVRIAAGEVSYCTAMVTALDKSDAVGKRVERKQRPRKGEYGEESSYDTVEEVTTSDPALHIWILTRRDAVDRLAKYSKMAMDAGVAERQVRLAEAYGEQIGRVIGNILDGLALTPKQQRKAPELVRTHLTAIEGSGQEVAA